MMHDRTHLFWSMWAPQAYRRRVPGGSSCLNEEAFFEKLIASEEQSCDRNWLEGTGSWPNFTAPAPALLGFDRSIMQHCLEQIGEWPQRITAWPPRCVSVDACVSIGCAVPRVRTRCTRDTSIIISIKEIRVIGE